MFTTGLYTATGGETRRVEDGQSTQKRLKMARASSAPPGRHTSWARTCVPHTMARTWAGPTQTGSRPAAPAGQPGQRGRQRPATADGARLGGAAAVRLSSAESLARTALHRCNLSATSLPPVFGFTANVERIHLTDKLNDANEQSRKVITETGAGNDHFQAPYK